MCSSQAIRSEVDRVTAYQPKSCVQELFRDIADKFPDAVALCENDRKISYRQLDVRSSQLARTLQQSSVGPGCIVALYCNRSIETVIAILAIVKSGAAYLPIDPGHPARQVELIVEDARPSFVLAHNDLVEQARERGLEKPVSLQKLLEESADSPETTPDIRNDPLDLLCVLFTSGSTGRPKGVMIPHRSVNQLVKGQNYAILDRHQVCMHLAPLAWDVGNFEIWAPLLNGARMAILPAPNPSVNDIAETIARHGVTEIFLSAALFHLMVDTRPEALLDLNTIMTGGDVLSPSHSRRLYEKNPNCQLVNTYGPCEDMAISFFYKVPRNGMGDGSVPIGQPIRHTDVFVLDDDLQPVPDGEIGELCLDGDGLALGYINRPDLTEKAFLDHPFSDEPGARLYRTGDLTRRRTDGQYEFFGRKDRQVKISGKRIELDEIEMVLRQNALLLDNAIILKSNDDLESKRIVAFLIPRPPFEKGELVRDVLADLREKLPEYMIPAEFSCLSELPLTSNGKVDRRALLDFPSQAPGELMRKNVRKREAWETSPASDNNARATTAHDKTTRIIREIWAEILGISDPGHDINFFDLGGNSLKMMRVHAELQKRFATDISLVYLFQHTTIASLASYLDSSTGDTGLEKVRSRASRQGQALQRLKMKKKGLRK